MLMNVKLLAFFPDCESQGHFQPISAAHGRLCISTEGSAPTDAKWRAAEQSHKASNRQNPMKYAISQAKPLAPYQKK